MKRNFTIGLSIFRVLLSLLLLKNLISYLPVAEELFGKYGQTGYIMYSNSMKSLFLYVLYPFHGALSAKLFLSVFIILTLMFMMGIGKRITGIFLFLMIIILQQKNQLIIDGSDNVMAVTLPFLIAADSFRYFTLIRPKNKTQGNPESVGKYLLKKISELACLGLMLQVCYIYFFTAIAKLHTDVWANGTALYYAMRIETFNASRWNLLLTENSFFVIFSTYFSLFFELTFAYLVWFRQTRMYILVAGAIFHICIWFFMGLDVFPWIMIATYFVFIPNRSYLYALESVRKVLQKKQRNKTLVYMDRAIKFLQ